MTFRLAVVVLVVCSLLGCTAQRAVMRPAPGTVAQRVDVGDQIKVFGKNGKFYELEVTEVGDGYLRGVNRGLNKSYRIPVSQIERMEYSEYSAVKTTGAVIGGTWIAATLFAVLLVAAFDGFEFGLCTDDGMD